MWTILALQPASHLDGPASRLRVGSLLVQQYVQVTGPRINSSKPEDFRLRGAVLGAFLYCSHGVKLMKYSSGYELASLGSGWSIPGVRSPACFRDMSATAPPESSSVLFPNGMHVHNAWHIAWASSDRASLSPTPPVLDYHQSFSVWAPGEPVTSTGSCPDCDTDDGHFDGPLIVFLVIGLPVIGLALMISWCICCICHARKRRTAAVQR
jgi:hypothetical protein